jgi:hypothetical protein
VFNHDDDDLPGQRTECATIGDADLLVSGDGVLRACPVSDLRRLERGRQKGT